MAIEQIMFFVLGFLAASLVAIVALPSVWKRAVRLTKKRIEAATPITMTEFRAEKDQMRAEFALSTRKLERTIETLHGRVTEQLSHLNTAQTEMAIAKAERNRSLAVQTELEERAAESNARIHELEKEVVDLSQQLRGHTRDLEELAAIAVPQNEAPAAKTITNINGAISAIRRALSFGDRETFATLDGLDEAYSRISNAGSRLDALLEEEPTAANDDVDKVPTPTSLAARLSEEDALEGLHDKILHVQQEIAESRGIKGNKESRASLRDELGAIADTVSTIVYSGDSADEKSPQTLFERISKFTGDALEDEKAPAKTATPVKQSVVTSTTSVSDRMAAFGKAHLNS